MQNVSETYRRLLADPEHTKQVKVDIAGTEYGEDRITALSISGGMFPDLVVGNCFAREIDLTVEADGQVPRMARIAVYVRLAAGRRPASGCPGACSSRTPGPWTGKWAC